ncbi:MAG: rubrerythrin [Alphaproteobacteria bacterium]|jgi:bacterioferritin|nr:rubrerythrin [Alphaproteobacteria bacterium]
MTPPTIAEPQKLRQIVDQLIVSYWMEIETVQNYLACSVNPDGVRATEIKESLENDIQEELGHAQQIAQRIHTLGGTVPGSKDFNAGQDALQPPKDSTDVLSIIKGVIEAEDSAIEQYRKLIELTEGSDWVTQDMVIALMRDEQQHRREFVGYLAEYDKELAKKLESPGL